MRRFSLNPLDPKNVRAAIAIGIVWAAIYAASWIASYVGAWVYWVFFIVLWKVCSNHYEKQAAEKRKRIDSLGKKRTR